MKLLVVVDMQNDFLTGTLANKDAVAIIPNVLKEIENFRDSVIVATRDTHGENYLETSEGKNLPVTHCIVNTWGWQIENSIQNAIEKNTLKSFINKNSFGLYDWKEALAYNVKFTKFDTIELIGTCTDICVVSNALILKALYPETRIVVKADCCAGTTKENHEAALQTMRSCQIEVI